MSIDTPDEPPPWVTGPGPDYTPPPPDALVDDATRTRQHEEGRKACLDVLGGVGIRKTENGWKTDDREGERP